MASTKFRLARRGKENNMTWLGARNGARQGKIGLILSNQETKGLFLALVVHSRPLSVEFWHVRISFTPLRIDTGL